jgi:hypothetical protein
MVHEDYRVRRTLRASGYTRSRYEGAVFECAESLGVPVYLHPRGARSVSVRNPPCEAAPRRQRAQMTRWQAALQICVVHVEFLAASMRARFAEDARGKSRPEDEIFSSPANLSA